MTREPHREAVSRYGPFFRVVWAVLALVSPVAVFWAVRTGDPNDVLFGFGLVLASWSALADVQFRLPDAARIVTGITLVAGVAMAVVGLLFAPFATH